jgi:hypothetical protein
MNNTTNTIHNTLFTAKNEERFLKTFEKLVDHIVKTPLDQPTAEWLATYAQAAAAAPVTLDPSNATIASLRKQLAEANAKLSSRF